MADALPRVIRIPRSDLNDNQGHFVLVHVESAGKHPLDVKLVGTDGESVFSVSCKLPSRSIVGPISLAVILCVNTHAN
jgi:hypothetical protein